MAQSQEGGDNADGYATMLRKAGVRRRMRCSGNVAHSIKEAFPTVVQLLEACESDEPLTDYDGIGPASAEAIENWYEHREERERNMTAGTVTERSVNSATIALHSSWADELGIEVDDDD